MKYPFCIFILLTGFFSSCNHEFEPIDYGHEACAFCKMSIVDKRFAAEMINNKGKVFKFDDIKCMKNYIYQNKIMDNNSFLFVADFLNSNDKFLEAKNSYFLHSDNFKSPMNGNYAAFQMQKDSIKFINSSNSLVLNWYDIN